MPRVGKRIVAALAASSLSSFAYLALALYQLFEIAEQDKVMFMLLVSFTVEVVFWTGYLLWMFCAFTGDARWHLNRITLPIWDLVFVLILTVTGVQLQQIDGSFWWDFSDQSLYARITIVAVLVALPLKVISAGVLSEFYHRSYIREGMLGPQEAYRFEQSVPLTSFAPATAPPEGEDCY